MSESVAEPSSEESKPTFFDELEAFGAALPQKSLFAVLAVVWLGLFAFIGNSTFGYIDTGSLYSWAYASYNAPDSEDSHGNLIPFVVLGLIWWKRKELMAVEMRPSNWAFGIVVLAVLLHAVGFISQQPRISIVSLFVGLYGLMGLLWGTGWMRAVFFPYFLVIFCVPIGSLSTVVTFPLRILVSELAVAFATGVLDLQIIREGTLIFDADRTFQYNVAPACSGIRSLITLFALTTIYGFTTFRSPWRRVVMMFASVPLAVLGNLLRITTVIIVGDVKGMQAGLDIEQKLGFLTFLVAIVGVMILGHFLNEERKQAEPKTATPNQNQADEE